MKISLLILLAALGLTTSDPTFYECGVSTAEHDIIVDEHNKYRLQIARGELEGQPRGINLKRMAWDEKLAIEAQKVADLGKFEHLIVEDDRFPYGAVGQNLYMWASTAQSSSGSNWPSGVEAWWKEHENFVYGAETQNGVTGHYTQVVWADTYLVGCGYCYFYDNTTYLKADVNNPSLSFYDDPAYMNAGTKNPNYPYKKLYVCNYGPAGNWRGQNPYETGESGCENLC